MPAAAHPEGVATETDPIPPRHGRREAARPPEVHRARRIVARDATDRLLIANGGILGPDGQGRLFPPHLWLGLVIQYRKFQTIRPALADVRREIATPVLAGIVT